MRNIFLCFLLTILSINVHAQTQPYRFTRALFASVPAHYGREAIYNDLLAHQLYTNALSIPTSGGLFGKNDAGQDIKWQEIAADTAGRLRLQGRPGAGFGQRGGVGYMYMTYSAGKAMPALLNIRGNSAVYVNGVMHMGDAYSSGYLYIPVELKKGLNEFYVRGQAITASMSFPGEALQMNTEDLTLPSVRIGKEGELLGAITLINTSAKSLTTGKIRSETAGKVLETTLPEVPAMSTRKVWFRIDPKSVTQPGKINCKLTLTDRQKQLNQTQIQLEAVTEGEKYMVTFISEIDGSLQYYAVTPQVGGPKPNAALFLSVHGAGVEAIGQARAYHQKDWGTLVAATNRRPRGFNWEDWGRLDALEVLDRAKTSFKPDPQQVYLTGHSMGGHGTWFLGATYPDKWAAIGACSGYPTLKGYGSADGLIPDSSGSAMEQMLLRTSNQSDVLKLVSNYKPLGVYVLHGDADRTVSVNYARQMRKVLGEFHTSMSYHEVVGGEHWFGDESVDWPPLFDFFKWHKLPVDTAVNVIDFTTANPGISSSYFWASILQQSHPLQYSRIQLERNRNAKSISGKTENVNMLCFKLKDLTGSVKISLDGSPAISYTKKSELDSVMLVKEGGAWKIAEAYPTGKNPSRYGTFKDAFNYRMVFVYGTAGTKEENDWARQKAAFDAETWYYRGNGAVDVIPDTRYSAEIYAGRGVIIFGNATTNKAWKTLLADCPIQLERNRVTAGDQNWTGGGLAAYFVWPLKNSPDASVAVIGGTGIQGMKAANANQYFAGASGFPDFMIFDIDMVKSGSMGVKYTGFFDNNWKLNVADFVANK
jgi:pimeloyl-ACP methyl ester carboxylesterase